MDTATRSRLTRLRQNVPRYLFRGWTSSSGGSAEYNTTTTIRPGAFVRGSGHESPYDMTRSEFTNMAIGHLTGVRTSPTEFSSFGASISVAMSFCTDPQNGFISIIDTKMLGSKVQIFFVPDLEFLSPGNMRRYPHEYLAHGVIEGEHHRALPYRAFLDASLVSGSLAGYRRRFGVPESLTEDHVLRARGVAEQYGPMFTLPMMLAIIARSLVEASGETRNLGDMPEARLIIEGVADGLVIRGKWDHAADRVYVGGAADIQQFLSLLVHYGRHVRKKTIYRNIQGRRIELSEVQRSKQPRTEEAKSPEEKRQETEEKMKKTRAKLARELGIDMNRYGYASGNNEVDIEEMFERLDVRDDR